MKNICILFNAGSYGTFLEWCLHYFSGATDSIPFNSNGNSHKWSGNHLLNISHCKSIVVSLDADAIVRFHPKSTEIENITDSLTFATENFKKVIYLTPTDNSIAWSIDNKFEKIWKEGWAKHEEWRILENLTAWNVKNLDEMESWELREFLSLYIYPQHLAETELEKLQDMRKEFTKVQFIPIELLRDDFKNTIIHLLDYCDLMPVRLDQIDKIYKTWIELQYHRNKDQTIKFIVDASVNNEFYE